MNIPVLLFPVLQVLGPGLAGVGTALFRARVPPVDLLVSLQLAGEGEPPLTAVVGALVRWQLGVLLAHVGLQLIVLLKLESAAIEPTQVRFPVRAVNAADVSGPVRIGRECLLAVLHGAVKRLHAAVAEVMSVQVRLTTEGLPATVATTWIRFYPRVFTQVSVQLPLFVISRQAAHKRADIRFSWLRISFHIRGIDNILSEKTS